jgi:hypothetical protein
VLPLLLLLLLSAAAVAPRDPVRDEQGEPILDEEGRETPWSWNQLVSGGFVEYVDTEEEETTLIAMTMRDLAMQREAVSSAGGLRGGQGGHQGWLYLDTGYQGTSYCVISDNRMCRRG